VRVGVSQGAFSRAAGERAIVDRRTLIHWKQALRANYWQIFFVFMAFLLMVLVSYFSIGAIVRQQAISGVDEAMLAAEANVRAGFAKSEATLDQTAHRVRNMLDRTAPPRELLDFLTK
jgi:alpha/beta superfamily hydrolase